MSGGPMSGGKGMGPVYFENDQPVERDKDNKCVKCGRVVSDAVLRHNCPSMDDEPGKPGLVQWILNFLT